jgi:hypothetical protein
MYRKIAYPAKDVHTICQNVLLGCLASSEYNANLILYLRMSNYIALPAEHCSRAFLHYTMYLGMPCVIS